MERYDKLRQRLLSGASDANIGFSALCQLLKCLGFNERIRGDHPIFAKGGVDEIIDLQPKENKAKAYQVKQVRNLILKHRFREHKELGRPIPEPRGRLRYAKSNLAAIDDASTLITN